jgi:hypothetical protein
MAPEGKVPHGASDPCGCGAGIMLAEPNATAPCLIVTKFKTITALLLSMV